MNEKKRYLLKLSGESLSGEGGKSSGRSFDGNATDYVAKEIGSAVRDNPDVELGIVVGAGNLIRGAELAADIGTTPVVSDQTGMLATVINALILQDFLEKKYEIDVRVSSAVEINSFVEPYFRRRAINHLKKGRVVIFAAGTGDPRFTTDTASVLRAIEIGAPVVLKGTKVDGLYDSDPKQNPDAKFIEKATYKEFQEMGLKVMDMTAATLAEENNIETRVFDLFTEGNLSQVLSGKDLGSLITVS